MPARALHDTPEFRAMWEGGWGVGWIAKHFGVTDQAIYNSVKQFRYPSREPIPRLMRPADAPEVVPEAEDVPEPKPAPHVGKWTTDRDARLVATKGKYAELCALADKWSLGIRAVTARYHLVRP